MLVSPLIEESGKTLQLYKEYMTKTQKEVLRWRKDPVYFVRSQFGVEPDEWQREVLERFNTDQRIAMKASKGPGKTCVIAWCCWLFLATRPHPKIAATSISAENLSDGLWSEMAKWQNNSPYLREKFKWTKTRIFSIDHSETWWMSARAWSKSATGDQQSNTLAGLHADYILFVLDESGGIPDAVMAAAEAALSVGIECKLMQAGNPTHLEGPLYRACTSESDLWTVIEINGDPDNPKRSKRISIEWARQQIEKYGKDNPWVLINVFGRFPPSSLNALLGPDEVQAAMDRHHDEEVYQYSEKRLGIDVARFGDDRSVIFPRQGLASFNYVEMRGARSNEVAARAIKAKEDWGSDMEFVDGTGGYGSGVVDSMMQAGYTPEEIHFSSKPLDSSYRNRRAEMWFEMAKWIKRGGALPHCMELKKELTAPTYFFQDGKFMIEKKDQIKDRLGYSPDVADALALTFALPDKPRMDTFAAKFEGKLPKPKSEWEPLDERRKGSEWDPLIN